MENPAKIEEIHREPDERVKNRYITVVKAEKWWAEKARNNPIFFQEYMTGMVPADHHKIWLANLFHPQRFRLNFIAPRESAKTTVLVYAMLWNISRNPLSTNAVISVSSDQAEKRLNMIAATIEDTDRYRNVFPHIAIDHKQRKTQTEFTIMRTDVPYNVWRGMVQREGSLKDPTLRTSGAGGRGVIGARLSGWLLLDDIIDANHLSERAQDQMMEYIIQTLEPCVMDGAKIANIGTRWMVGDVPERLMNNPEFFTIVIPAIKFDDEGNRYSYWPEFWPLHKLDKKKRTMNNDALFGVMYMCDPQAMTESLFTPESLARDIPHPLPKMKHLYVVTDQATSTKQRADFNVYQAIGIDYDDNYYILDQTRFKADPAVQLSELANFVDKVAATYLQLDEVLFENVGAQASLPQIFISQRPDVPIAYHVPKGDKDHRARNISNLALMGRLFINQKMAHIDALKQEWINYPLLHDDTLDPIGLLFQYKMKGISVAGVRSVKSSFLI